MNSVFENSSFTSYFTKVDIPTSFIKKIYFDQFVGYNSGLIECFFPKSVKYFHMCAIIKYVYDTAVERFLKSNMKNMAKQVLFDALMSKIVIKIEIK